MFEKESVITRVGVYAVALKETKLLVVKQKKGPHQGKLDLPGGGIESGETIEEALRREIQEELGMTFKTMSLLNNFTANSKVIEGSGRSYSLHQIGLIYAINHLSSSLNSSSELEHFFLPINPLSEVPLSPFLLQTLYFLKGKTYDR